MSLQKNNALKLDEKNNRAQIWNSALVGAFRLSLFPKLKRKNIFVDIQGLPEAASTTSLPPT